MAGDWIPMRLDLADDPAVVIIAELTGFHEDTVVGKLHRLWSWANRQSRDGHARVTRSWIDKYLYSPGFAAAMVEAGWLVETKDGLSIPNFDRWNSQNAKRRMLATKRKQDERSRSCHAVSVTKTRPEKRREEFKYNPLPPSGGEELLEALAAATGEDPSLPANRDKFDRVKCGLLAAAPPYAPQDVQDFARRYKTLCTYSAAQKRERPSLNEIAKHIGLVRSTVQTAKYRPPPPSREVIADRLRKGQPVSESVLRLYPDLAGAVG